MDKRVLGVGVALLLVAGAFLAFPPTTELPAPPVAGDLTRSGEAPPPGPAGEPTGPSAPPHNEPELAKTAVDIGCYDLYIRLSALVSLEFSTAVSKAARAKYPNEDQLIAKCKEVTALPDAELMKSIADNLGVTP